MDKMLLPILFCLAASIRADTNYRLNAKITPIAYSIAITPNFDTFTFEGEVSISLITNETNIKSIKLHSEELNFNATEISVSTATTLVPLDQNKPLEFDSNYTFVFINLRENLAVNTEYVVAISYVGPIRKDMKGFYRSSYVENGVTKWLGATQMEPTHARKVFPCFDEPSYKATFTLTINRPENYSKSLTNMKLYESVPLANGLVRETFYPSPIMSTYLLAFLVSEFQAGEYQTNGTREFGVFSRPDMKNQSQYAFEFGTNVVEALGEYFGIDYYSTDEHLKLDHVALPDFSAGAMENWGLVKYREALLLYAPEDSTPYYKYRVAQIVAHETTHMWFGDLVTCHWWSNTWLNEGFANYFQDYITDFVDPEVDSASMLVTGSVHSAFEADEVDNPPAITNEDVNSPAEISGHFGTITYQKAGSVIRMIHHLIGDEAFKIGLRDYLDSNRHGMGYPELLYTALNKGVNNTSSLSPYVLKDIVDIMGPWIVQPGHPVLDVEVDDGVVNLSQRRFYSNPEKSSDELYPVPVTYTTQRKGDFANTKPAFIMNTRTYVLNVTEDLSDDEWIIFNIQETGLYRVNYDRASWTRISNALSGERRWTIDHLNRAKIINDLFAFLDADVVQFEVLHEALEFLHDEDDYSVWLVAIRGLDDLRNTYYGTDLQADIDSYTLHLMENIIETLGYDVNSTDSFVTLRNRMQILDHACKLGHEECIINAILKFESLKDDGVPVPPSLRPTVYCNALRHGTAEDYDFLYNKMLSTNVANEALVILSALGCTKVEEKLRSFLESPIVDNTGVRLQDAAYTWTYTLADHSNADLALNVLISNYSSLANSLSSVDAVIGSLAGSLHTSEQFEKFETWLSSCQECSEDMKTAAKASLDEAKATSAWAEEHKGEIRKSLVNSGINQLPSFGMIFVVILSVLFA